MTKFPLRALCVLCAKYSSFVSFVTFVVKSLSLFCSQLCELSVSAVNNLP